MRDLVAVDSMIHVRVQAHRDVRAKYTHHIYCEIYAFFGDMRIDIAAAYRFTPHTQLKLQYGFQHATTGPGDDNHLLAAQFTIRF